MITDTLAPLRSRVTGDRESWTVITMYRREVWEAAAPDLDGGETWRGPGQPFTHAPWVLPTKSRRYVWVLQRGGLDI